MASGSLFPTGSKDDATPISPAVLAALAGRAAPVPLVAIGGIGVDNAGEAARLGASGVAVIRGLWSAVDVAERARGIRAAFASGVQRNRNVR